MAPRYVYFRGKPAPVKPALAIDSTKDHAMTQRTKELFYADSPAQILPASLMDRSNGPPIYAIRESFRAFHTSNLDHPRGPAEPGLAMHSAFLLGRQKPVTVEP